MQAIVYESGKAEAHEPWATFRECALPSSSSLFLRHPRPLQGRPHSHGGLLVGGTTTRRDLPCSHSHVHMSTSGIVCSPGFGTGRVPRQRWPASSAGGKLPPAPTDDSSLVARY